MAYFNSEKGTFWSQPDYLPIPTYRIINTASSYLYNNEDVMSSGPPNSTHKQTNNDIEHDGMDDQRKEYPHMSLSVA
jgi:hypothetical protein